MASPVSEIPLLSKTSNFPFRTMVVKKIYNLELAQKFMQVEVKVKCMGTNFGWRGLSGFGDFAPFYSTISTIRLFHSTIFSTLLQHISIYMYMSLFIHIHIHTVPVVSDLLTKSLVLLCFEFYLL